MIDALPIALDRPDLLWALLAIVPFVGLTFWSRRRMSTRRRTAALTVRIALITAIALALAGPTWLTAVDALGVVFVVDRSASVGGAGSEQARAFIEAALAHQGPDDRAGIVVFGAEAMVESEPRAELTFHGVEARPSPHQSDLAAGLRLATALLPSDRARRIVLLSDGEQTHGDVTAQALANASDDLTVSVVELGGDDGFDVLLEDLLAPAKVDEGAAFDLRVVIASEVPTTGALRLYRNDTYLGEVPVTLEATNRSTVLSFRQEARAAGLYRFRAAFEPDDPTLDRRPQNNQVVTTVQVTGRPRILVAESDKTQATALLGVLRAEGFEVDLVDAGGVPPSLTELRAYDAVFLSDVPAFALSSRQQRALRSYVRDLGRGLVMIGGENSFGVGGYYNTPVESALPVGMDIEDKTRFPKLGMVHAIDKSCSMGSGGGSKLFLAKEAALQTVDLLSPTDMLGVIGFDGAASFIVPLGDLQDKQRVIDDISSIRSGGSTDIYPALERSIAALRDSDAALKHIILLSDGMTEDGAFEPLITKAHDEHQITLTAIGIGSDSDRTTMEDFAKWGGGNHYLVTDPAAIPAIFTRETLLATRAFLKEEDVSVRRVGRSELAAGIDASALPQLHGYVVATPKPRATVPLVVGSESDDPLLAHWRYGLGRSVAWTSDAKGRWASDWVGTPAYTRLWGQIARWAASRGGDDGVQLTTTLANGRLEITVDAFEATGGFRNFLAGQTRIVAPDLSVHSVDLRQVAPGRYRASMPVDQDGSWLVGVSLTDDGRLVGQAVEEAVQPYSPEYRQRGLGAGLLAEVARVGNGRLLTRPEDVFARPDVARRIPLPLWPWFVVLAAVLLVLDVAVRRLSFGSQTARMTRPAPPPVRPSPLAKPSVRPTVATPDEPDDHDALEAPAPPEVDPTSYAGRLLAARRSGRKKRDGGGPT